MPAPFNPYQNTQVVTSSPEKILLMLYDGAINFTKIAQEKMSHGDFAGKGKFISKAQAIVSELMNTLNHDIGGEISRRLEQLYIYLIDEYINANIQNSQRSLDNAVKILTMLRDTWVDAIRVWKDEKEAAAQSRPMQAGQGR